MTDEQIVKALECCENEINFCSICPYFLQNKENDFCKEDMAKDALDLIKRQQAEIEKLNKVKVFNFNVSGTKEIMPILFCHEKELKNEAIKEFAERLKARYCTLESFDLIYVDEIRETIEKLVREMTVEKK